VAEAGLQGRDVLGSAQKDGGDTRDSQPEAAEKIRASALAYRRDYAAEIAALINARARVKRGLTSRVQEQRRLVDLGLPKSHVAELLAGTPAHGQTREGNSGDAELV